MGHGPSNKFTDFHSNQHFSCHSEKQSLRQKQLWNPKRLEYIGWRFALLSDALYVITPWLEMSQWLNVLKMNVSFESKELIVFNCLKCFFNKNLSHHR